MEVIDLSGKFLLEAMFQRLHLPRPQYHSRAIANGKYVVTVDFYPTIGCLEGSSRAVSLTGRPSNNMATAMDNAATRAIRHMENCQKKVLKDYNYAELKKTKETNLDLTASVNERDEKITEQNMQIREMSKGWADYLEEVFGFSAKIHNLAKIGLAPDDSTDVKALKKALVDIHDAIADMDRLSRELVLEIQTKGIYPYHNESDSTDSDASLGYLEGYNDDTD